MRTLHLMRYGLSILFVSAAALAVIFWYAGAMGGEGQSAENKINPAAIRQAERLIDISVPYVDTDPDRYRPLPADTGLFRVPDGLRPVVDFWKRVYTGIYSFQAIVHDARDVTRVYGIVDLRREARGAGSSFDDIRRAARGVLERYKGHLQFLLREEYDPDTLSGERRRLHMFIAANGGRKSFKDADRTIRLQRGLRDTFIASIERSGRYMEEYRRIFREQNLPEELALLPHLESSFQFSAQSHAGAVGIWQLTRGASANLIQVNSAVDERIDPWSSARAAARIFTSNYRSLRSWPLAITAYNQGLGAMRRAVSQLGTRNIDTVVGRYRGRSFGFAGRNFYCAFVATVEVVHNHEDFFGHLSFDQPIIHKRHTLQKSAPLDDIARDLGVEKDRLAELNPHLRGPARTSTARIPRGAVLNLPADAANTP